MKPVLMIHDVCENMFDLPLENYILTFDDGLYSQYYYLPQLKNVKTRKILFPSGKYTSNGLLPRRMSPDSIFGFMNCIDARRIFDETDGVCNSQYMSIPEILKMKENGFEIGGHGFAHRRTYPNSLRDKVREMTEDVKKMFYWLSKNIYITPTSYCFPFNIKPPFMEEILRRYGIQEFFGPERIPVESLL